MHTTLGLVESLCSHYGNISEYALAPRLGISKNTIYAWRCRGSVMADETGIKAAKILGFSEDEVLLSLAAERAKGTPLESSWKRIFEHHAA